MDLIEGIIVDLLQTKWRCFVKQVFFRQLTLYTIYFLISSVVFVGRPHANYPAICTNSTNVDDIFTNGTMDRVLESEEDIEISSFTEFEIPWGKNSPIPEQFTNSLKIPTFF